MADSSGARGSTPMGFSAEHGISRLEGRRAVEPVRHCNKDTGSLWPLLPRALQLALAYALGTRRA